MASMEKLALLVVWVVAIGSAYANVIRHGDDHILSDLKLEGSEDTDDDMEHLKLYKLFLDYLKPPTVGHFATHNLCLRLRKPFEAVIQQKLLGMSDAFVEEFVDNLCDKDKPHVMLKLWVAELFDADGDGYVEYHEQYNVIDHNYSD